MNGLACRILRRHSYVIDIRRRGSGAGDPRQYIWCRRCRHHHPKSGTPLNPSE